MNNRSIILYALRSSILASVFFTFNAVKAQNVSQKELQISASKISRKTGNAYNLIRLGNYKTPAILTINRSNAIKVIPESQRNDIAAVRNFALAEAQFVAANALVLPDNSQLKETGTSKIGNLWLSSYIVSYEGIPLRERFLRMNIGAINGEVVLVRNNIPSKQPNTLSSSVSGEDILQQTQSLLGLHSEFKTRPKLVFIDEAKDSFLRLCYELIASEPDMNELWRLTFDAKIGLLIEKKSLLEHENVCNSGSDFSPSVLKTNGLKPVTLLSQAHYSNLPTTGRVLAKVHLHTPFDTLTTVGMPFEKIKVNGVSISCDSDGTWFMPSSSYPLTIETSFNSKILTIYRQDKIANSTLKRTIQNGSPDVLWDDSNSDPSERDAYYSAHIAYLSDKREDEKLTNLDFHMKVNVNIDATCNAYYIPTDTSINFFNSGPNCSNTGQIADVIFHEYGHRVTNARYQMASGGDNNIVDGSLGEGFADLNSAFIRDDPRIGIGFYGNNTKVIRNCDNTKKWPRDINPDIHISGEIISGAFWDLRKAIGLSATEHLFHFMEYQMPDGIGITDTIPLEEAFSNTLIATIITDDDDNNLANGTPHLKDILAAFKLHNISLSDFIPMSLSKIKDQDTSASFYNAILTASYNGIAGAIDEKNVLLHYSTDEGKTFITVPMKSIGNSRYEGVIPKVPLGTIVKYYSSLTSPIDELDTMTSPSPERSYSFTVGFRQVVFDGGEAEKGWSMKALSDKATTGIWVRGKPHGTFSNPNPPINYIQQDTDHSVNGTMCYITGNRIDTSGNNSPGYDDVDGGATTLETPVMDLSKFTSPFIRFWYYYSNDKGQNAGVPKWQTDISNDNGATWKSLQLTNQSTNGVSGYPEWTEFSFRAADFITLSPTVKIRFIASDYIGALVEAGVDDLEVLDPIKSGSESVISDIPNQPLPYPNPIHRGGKIYFLQNGIAPVAFIDLIGRVILRSEIPDGYFVIPSNTDPGIYFIEQAGHRYKIVVLE